VWPRLVARGDEVAGVAAETFGLVAAV